MNYYDQIDDYVQNNLKDEVRLQFEKAMEENSALLEAVEDAKIALMMGEASFEESIITVINEELKDKKEEEDNLLKNNKKNWFKFTVILLIAILGVFYVYKWNHENPSNPTQSYASLYERAPGWSMTRGDDDISTALVSYNKGNVNRAISQLKALNTARANYWIVEMYADRSVENSSYMDSTLHYIKKVVPSNKAMRDRLFYLEIISLVGLDKTQQVKEKVLNLPEDFDNYYDSFLSRLEIE